MAIFRVFNPHRRRRRKKNSGRKASSSKRRRRVVARKNPGAAELVLMANPKKNRRKRNRRRAGSSSHRFYAKNPHRVRHYRRHRNPSLGGGTLKTALYASAGAVGTRAITQAVLQDKNQGVYGYFGNAVSAYGLGWLLEKFAGAAAGEAALIGGLISLVLRIAKELVFASGPLSTQLALSGLGDADFALKGYVTDPYFVPTTSVGPDQVTQPPQVIPVLPPATAKGASMSGYDSGAMGGRGALTPARWASTWN